MKTSIFLACLFAASVCFAVDVFVEDAAVSVGEDAVIPCNYEADGNDVKIVWRVVFKNGSKTIIGNAANRKFEAVRSGLTTSDDGTLTIPSCTLKDNDLLSQLECEVQFGKVDEISKKLNFIVALLPEEDPTITLNGNAFHMEDFLTNVATCKTGPSYPVAEITYYKKSKDGETFGAIGDDIFNSLLDSSNYAKTDDGYSETTEKDLSKKLEASDDMAEFVCGIKTVYGNKVFARNYTMGQFRVYYTTTSVEFEDKPVAYLGETITLKCKANGYPDATITINGEDMSEKSFEVTAALDQTEYQCSAFNNDAGDAVVSDVYKIEVLSLKEPMIEGATEGKMEVAYGEALEITCSSVGRPTPSVVWYKGDNKVSDTETLTIAKTNFEDSGTYQCRASNGHEMLKKSTDVEVAVKGMILEGEEMEMVSGKKDDEPTLVCAVISNPAPTFKWSDEEATTSEVKTGYTYTSQVTVGPLSTELSEKTYTCTATTPDGAEIVKTFKLPDMNKNTPTTQAEIVEASSATAGIIIAILVVLLIVAIILAVLYNKGIIFKKQEKGEESAEGDIAVEINNDDGDVEAGNGKAAAETEPLVEGNNDDKMLNGENSNE